jgi:glutathione peroxidase
MAKAKKTLKWLLIFLLVFTAYVLFVNRNSQNMTARQKILKAIYPALMFATKLFGANTKVLTGKSKAPNTFYTLNGTKGNGQKINLNEFKGKKLLLVNTASNCGYTHQYEGLQQLQQKYANSLVVLGFPANDFKEQEKDDDTTIASFCKLNYGVTFTIMQKSVVVKSNNQNEIYEWLSNPAKNGWNSQAPSWNFAKYLINENGDLTHYFDPSINPLGSEVTTAIEQ